jgi:hypothetical protein
VFALVAMFALSGDRHGYRSGWRKSGSKHSYASMLDVLDGKQDNPFCMGKSKNPNAQALGALGGKARAKKLSDAEIAKIASKGGKARAAKLSAAERSMIAKLAVAARERHRKGKR